jgi:hypothetical protein
MAVHSVAASAETAPAAAGGAALASTPLVLPLQMVVFAVVWSLGQHRPNPGVDVTAVLHIRPLWQSSLPLFPASRLHSSPSPWP